MQNKQALPVSPVDALTKGVSASFDFKFTAYNSHDIQEISSEQLLSTANENVKQQARQGFRINDYNFMLKFADGNQISEIPDIYPLPNAPRWFLGMANINGQTLPVFNLKSYFGIEDRQKPHKKKPMLFILQQGKNATGIMIDGLLERLTISDKQIQDNIEIPIKLANFIDNAYLLNQEIWYDMDCLAFLDEIETSLVVN